MKQSNRINRINRAAARIKRTDRIMAAAERIGAVWSGTAWYYLAKETGEIYRVTEKELHMLGPDNYSEWAAQTGRLITKPNWLIKTLLGR